LNVIQIELKFGEVTQFSQFSECRNVRELLIRITKNRVECDTAKVQGREGHPVFPIPRVPICP
jgi:hypothetical protein